MQAFKNALGLGSNPSGKGAPGPDSHREAIVEINVVDQSLELLDAPAKPEAEEEKDREQKAESEGSPAVKEEAVAEEEEVVAKEVPEAKELNGDLEISLEDFESR